MWSILSEEFLRSISYESSLGVNLSNFSMSRFTDDDLDKVLHDLFEVQESFEYILIKALKHRGIGYRIKSPDSVSFKIRKYKENVKKARLCFNDLIGIRVVLDDYHNISEIPSYFRVVDLTNGKSEDDGYRAIHLYYQLSNRHYPIEIQIWKKSDVDFINWCHKYCYKCKDNTVIRKLRTLFDNGKIDNEDDFVVELKVIEACNYMHSLVEEE